MRSGIASGPDAEQSADRIVAMRAGYEPFSPTRPLTFDARCMRCGYNLRGLSGDPIGCPECGFMNELRELDKRFSLRTRFRELRGAGDAILLAVLGIGLGVLFWSFRGPWPLALPILVGSGVLAHLALAACTRVMPGQAEWRPLLFRYVGWTCLLGLTPIGLWILFAVLTWRLTTTFSAIRAGALVDVVHIAAAAAPTALVLYVFRPTRRIRWRQRRAFGGLVRMLKGRGVNR